MIALRPKEEAGEVAIGAAIAAIGVAAATHAWIASSLFGVLALLRFALQPPDDRAPTRRRRLGLALLGCATLACVVWALGVRIAHWPG